MIWKVKDINKEQVIKVALHLPHLVHVHVPFLVHPPT